ncbi:MAG: ribosome silencing factor [Acidimicrobiales bacterium]
MEGDRASSVGKEAQLARVEVPLPARVAAIVANEKSGHDTVVLAMGELLNVVDAFVVTSGATQRHVRSLVEEIERRLKAESDLAPASVEGMQDGSWVLLDYGDFIVHVFLDETRAYYDLEHLWSGAPRVDWS